MNFKIHFITLSFAFLFSIFSYAQMDKGTWMIGGNLSGSSYKNESSDTTISSSSNGGTFSILPQVGYFITKNIVLGASVGYTNSTSNSESNNTRNVSYTYTIKSMSKNVTQNLQFGILAGYYTPINERIYFNTYLSLNYRTPLYTYQQYRTTYSDGTEYTNLNDNTKQSGGTFTAALQPGISFFVTPKLALEASIGVLNYSLSTFKDSKRQSNNTNSGISLGINSISLGIRYFIPKKA